MMAMFFCAEPLVRLVLTEKWLPCVPFLRIFCITYMFYPIHTANLNAIKAMGRSGVYLKLEIIKKIMGLTLLLLTYHISVMAMAYSLILSSLLSQLINTWPNRKLLDYRYLEQLKDILPSILLAIFMGLLHVAGQSCTSAGHRNAGHSDPDRCSGVSGRFCTAEAGYV